MCTDWGIIYDKCGCVYDEELVLKTGSSCTYPDHQLPSMAQQAFKLCEGKTPNQWHPILMARGADYNCYQEHEYSYSDGSSIFLNRKTREFLRFFQI